MQNSQILTKSDLKSTISQLFAIKFKYFAFCLLILLTISCLLYFLLSTTQDEHLNHESDHQKRIPKEKFNHLDSPFLHLDVHLWSKAAFGEYVWENILQGPIHEEEFHIKGQLELENVNFHFLSGPSVKVETLEAFPGIRNLILILNWRNREKINYSLPWLEMARIKPGLENVGIIALGAERCDNDWVLAHLDANPRIKFLFVIYDWNRVDNERIHQWPLGLATYRNFPPNTELTGDEFLLKNRPYLCNFIATVYPNSSRQELSDLFRQNPELSRNCLVRTRPKWRGHESEDSMTSYVEALRNSDLTLSPAGLSHECYRILEAVEYGSTPVIELNLSHLHRSPSCDQTRTLRLFQELNAPFIYVGNWSRELPGILQDQAQKSAAEKSRARIELIKWYLQFKSIQRQRLIRVIKDRFN